ncbi:hypothetical protein [Methylobacterium radiotolerans]|uniref:hypothetical protein n=1 Tax=Methylobacterium radiotolerans TaxID=31998 RepID=UPI0010577EC7|nr:MULTISPECIES: hypothetical protein [Methylobacterium]MDE3750035.1 hypothetical protein [Methylobacterium radiotolerans]
MDFSSNPTSRFPVNSSRLLTKPGKLLTLAIAVVFNFHAVAAEEDGSPSRSLDSTPSAQDPKINEGLSDRIIVIDKGYEIHEAGVNFEPDESGVACFTKKGGFNTDDRGIHLTYISRPPDLYIKYDFDKISNKYNVIFGNNYCRYTVTIQREIKIDGRWKLSTMLK